MWLNDDATPTTPSPRPSSSGSGMGQGGITSELNPMGPGGLAKPPSTRPQHTTPDPEFATEVKKATQSETVSQTCTTITPNALVLPTGSAAHSPGRGPKPDSQGQLHGRHGEGEE